MQWLRKTAQNPTRRPRKAIGGRKALAEAFESRFLMSVDYALTDLAAFDNTTGNEANAAMIMDSEGNFYGTTATGGSNGLGTVYEMAAGTGTITTMASFTTSTGYSTQSGLVMDSHGNLYGTTPRGGQHNEGTVFEIAAGTSTITVIASFSTSNLESAGTLFLDPQGKFYGTTYRGGGAGTGTIFKISNGSSSVTTLASFTTGGGRYPTSGVICDPADNLYGTTSVGGANGSGVIFELLNGSSTITTLASLPANSGADQTAPLIMDSNGNLFGTTVLGGSNGDGSIYELPAGASSVTTLASMDSTTGINPSAGLILDSNGDLFGTTTSDGPDNFGTVFELASGSSTVNVLSSFDGNNASPGTNQLGNYPVVPSLNLDAQGILYGVAGEGGTNGLGAIFEVSPEVATHAVVAAQPTNVTAGTIQTITVDLESDSGQIDTSANAPVTLSIASGPTGATLDGTMTVSAVDGVATFSDLTLYTAGNYTLIASPTGLASGETSTIAVTASAAAKLAVVQQPSTTIAGQTISSVTVDVEDTFGNLITTDNSSVTFASNDSTLLNGTSTVDAVGGIATFTDLSIDKTGIYTLAGTDTGLTSATTISFSITPAAARQLVVMQQPINSLAGAPIGPVVADVEDAFGNLVTSDSSSVNMSTVNGSTLGGTTSVNAVGGVATFMDPSIALVGTYQLLVVDGALTLATTNSFTISPAAPAKLVFDDQPTTAVAGKTMGQFVVEVEDALGNLVVSDQSNVTLSATASLAGTRTANVENGIAVFSDLAITTAGIATLSASDAALSAANSAPITVIPTVVAGKKLAPMVMTPSTAFGTTPVPPKSLIVQVKNQAGLTVMTRKIPVQRNRATFKNLALKQAGNYTLVISDVQGQTLTQAFVVIAAAPAKIAFTSPSTVADGTANLWVRVLDKYGNLASARDGATVALRLNAGKDLTLNGTLIATITGGMAEFSDVSVSRNGRAQLIAAAARLLIAKAYFVENA